jgi:hypothetical protein
MTLDIRWNSDAFEAVLRDPALSRLCLQIAQKIADRAGEGIAALPGVGLTRTRAAAVTINGVGVGREHNGHVLIKAIDAGKL